MNPKTNPSSPQVVIVGGGFGGLYAAQALRDAPVQVTLIDKRNFHLFQPLLYQVATGGLSPADIASPLRAHLEKPGQRPGGPGGGHRYRPPGAEGHPCRRRAALRLAWSLATGAENHYFGQPAWEAQAPGLKTIEDAIEIRRRVLLAFEAAEREPDPMRRKAWTTFVVIGGGPTGVELAGAIAELAHVTLKGEFSSFDPAQAEIILLEGKAAILPEYPPQASAQAQAGAGEAGREGADRGHGGGDPARGADLPPGRRGYSPHRHPYRPVGCRHARLTPGADRPPAHRRPARPLRAGGGRPAAGDPGLPRHLRHRRYGAFCPTGGDTAANTPAGGDTPAGDCPGRHAAGALRGKPDPGPPGRQDTARLRLPG